MIRWFWRLSASICLLLTLAQCVGSLCSYRWCLRVLRTRAVPGHRLFGEATEIELDRAAWSVTRYQANSLEAAVWTMNEFAGFTLGRPIPRDWYFEEEQPWRQVFLISFEKHRGLFGLSAWTLRVPVLWTAWATLLPVAFPLILRRLRRRRPRGQGLCVKCGYDLRATPGRCPECGTQNPIASQTSPTQNVFERRNEK